MAKRGLRDAEIRRPRYGGFTRSDATRYLQNGLYVSAANTLACNANEVFYAPYWADTIQHVDQMTLNVTSAGAASTVARMGIYHADGDWQPTALVVDSGTVAVDSTGEKNVTVDVVLPPGPYLLAFNTDGAPSVSVTDGFFWFHFLGSWTGNQPRQIYASQTFAAFPDPGTAWTSHRSGSTGLQIPVYLRIL